MAVTTYQDLVSAMNFITAIFANGAGANTTPETINILGQTVTVDRIQAFFIPILPQLFIFIGVVIAIQVLLKLFKKFSR